jgi:hypothetical protein
MSAPRLVAVAVRTADPARAAVGLTLRGARVAVVRLAPLPEADPRVARALATLRALGHDVDAPPVVLREAHAVEAWGEGGAPREASGAAPAVLWLVRPGSAAPPAAPRDAALAYDAHEADELLDRVLAAGRAVVW